MNYRQILNKASNELQLKNLKSPKLDSELILAKTLNVRREEILLNLNKKLDKSDLNKFNYYLNMRSNHKPIAHIVNFKYFWKYKFFVDRNVLIPRPETELLIEKILKILPSSSNKNILDIGTGSGCILLSILKELPFARGLGIDISSKAIQIAKKNALNLDLFHRAKFRICDLKKFNIGKYNLVVSNPPYIALRDIKNLSKDIINYEPKIALNGGLDGLDLVKKVIYKSNYLLKRNGLLALEIGNNQYLKVSEILTRNGYRELSKVYDYNRNVRCIISTKVRFF